MGRDTFGGASTILALSEWRKSVGGGGGVGDPQPRCMHDHVHSPSVFEGNTRHAVIYYWLKHFV